MKVSVITVCLNAEKSIESCVNSVMAQTYDDIEYIVMDGGSTDNTLSILKKYPSIDHLVSKPDKGIFDAMNKALRLASGEIIYFLNSDDRFYDSDTVKSAVEKLSQHTDADLLFGNLIFENVPDNKPDAQNRSNFHFRDKTDLFRLPVPQQCYFYHKRSFEKTGLFNNSYSMCADYDWLLRGIDSGLNIIFTDQVFSYFNYQGLSYKKNLSRRIEKNKIIFSNASMKEILPYASAGIKNILFK